MGENKIEGLPGPPDPPGPPPHILGATSQEDDICENIKNMRVYADNMLSWYFSMMEWEEKKPGRGEAELYVGKIEDFIRCDYFAEMSQHTANLAKGQNKNVEVYKELAALFKTIQRFWP